MLTAESLYERALDHGNAGRHAAARRDLRTASERASDPDLAARISGTLAYLSAETGDADAAVAACTSALADDRISDHTRAVLSSQLGLIELRRGNADAAFDHLSAAALGLADDPAMLGRALLNRGLVHLDRNELDAAQSDFDGAARAFALSDEPVEQAKAQNNQGYAAMLTGDLVSAIRLMDASVPVLASLSPVAAAVGESDRAEVLIAAGMTSEAISLLRGVARVYGARGLRQAQAEAEMSLARAMAVDAPLEAAAIARRAARRFALRGNRSGEIRASALALASSIAGGRFAATIRTAARRSARELDALHRPAESIELRLQLARAQLRTEGIAAARATVRGLRLSSDAPVTTRLLSEEVRAELAAAAGRPNDTLRRAAAGLDGLQDWISTFGSLELQSGAVGLGRRLAVHGISAALDVGDPALVFDWSERVRALSSDVVRVRPPTDQVTAAQLTELRALRSGSPSPRSPEAKREAELRDAIRRRHWSDDGVGHVRDRAALDEVSASLHSDRATLIAHLWTGERLSALVISGMGATIVDLGAWHPVEDLLDGLLADLDMSAVTLSPSLSRAVGHALTARLKRLDDLLLAPLAALIGTSDRLVLTPAGALAGVPWTMLTTVAGRAVTVPTTASEWLSSRREATPLGSAGFAAGPDVERAESEVLTAAGGWGTSDTLVGEHATASAVSELAERVDLLHVAAHGRHSSENPLFSAFELADGAWFGYDIDQLERVPSVVVLSACELGRSATRWGLEALGMSRAWLHAGARAVISSPSAVADVDAATLLTAAHEHLAVGVGPSEALAAAARSTGISAPFLVHGSGW